MENAPTVPIAQDLLTTELSSKPGRAFSIASTNRFPFSYSKINESFLYLYQEGPVGARGKREAFSKRLWKTPRLRWYLLTSYP